MSVDTTLWNTFINWAFGVRKKVKIPSGFKDQVIEINKVLKNDKTGVVSTVFEYMVKSGTVDYKFESNNSNFNKILDEWKKNVNSGFSIDVCPGLRDVTTQYLRERWTSSLIGVKIKWARIGSFILPEKIWILNGSQINIEEKSPGVIGGIEYTLGKDNIPLINTSTETTIIKKPYNQWYEPKVTPYFVKKGTLFNALVKSEILEKQAEAVEEIIPYILSIKAGNDEMLKQGKLPTKKNLDDIEESIKKSRDKKRNTYGEGTTTAKLNYSVDLDHLLPDMTKFLNDTIIKPIDRNLLSSLGLVELEGFASNRQESIFNPKMLVEEVKDAVTDLGALYSQIAQLIVEKNKEAHSRFLSGGINIVPGKIKSFITNDMRILARSAYDRGLIDKKTFDEDYLELDFETVVSRRDIERRRNLEQRLYPYIIMNQEKDEPNLTKDLDTNDTTKEESPEKIKTEKDIDASFECLDPYCTAVLEIPEEATDSSVIRCPECGNQCHYADINYSKKKRHSGIKKYHEAPFDKNSELPSEVKNNMSSELQTIFREVWNDSFERNNNEERAFKDAWSVIQNIAEKNNKGIWERKDSKEALTIDHLPKELKKDLSIAKQIKLVKKFQK